MSGVMGVFRFKRFNVVNERSAMKVNTDGVLLGSVMTIKPEDRNMLDIGTGTGTIALMTAQRLADVVEGSLDGTQDDRKNILNGEVILSEAKNLYEVDAIDVDEPSAAEASMNFVNSPWAECLHVHNMSLAAFAAAYPDKKYDLIFSNPPYFEDSLTAPDERKSTARHTSEGLSYREIFEYAKDRLTENGRVSLVLPADQEAALCRYGRMCGLYLFRIMRIRTVPRKAPSRIIAEFSRLRTDVPSDEMLTIQNEGKYTQEYLSLTKDFYLFA